MNLLLPERDFALNLKDVGDTPVMVDLEQTHNLDHQFDLARTQSFDFFQDILNDHWNRLRNITSAHQDHIIPNDPAAYVIGSKIHKYKGNNKVPIAWFQSHYEPEFSCMFQQRVGGNGNGDGPKWVCDPHRLIELAKIRKKIKPDQTGCLVYSIGSNGDFSFEEALQNLLGKETCEIHIFDMDDYEEEMPKDINLFYHKWGISDKAKVDKKGLEFKTFQETLDLLGHKNMPSIDIFKIDCEGCEFETQSDLLDKSTPILQQILVEVHGYKRSSDVMANFFDRFKDAGYVRFSKEHNIQFPDMPLSEYSLLKLSEEFRI